MTWDLTLDRAPMEEVRPSDECDVRGGGGITLHVREWGNPRGPEVLFVHGWSQSDLCWEALVGGLAGKLRMITFDMRGHGRSQKPLDASCYADAGLWANDIAAVIEGTRLERPAIVAWSYGGLVLGDYLRAYGQEGIAGINLVGAAVVLRPPAFDHIGPGLLENARRACSPDLSTSIAAMQRFLRSCTARPLGDDIWSAALCWNMVVPPEVRGALISREVDNDDVLGRLSIPVLVTHGREDLIVLPSMAEHVVQVCPSAATSWYEGVGHMPFLEAAERFSRELADFADRTASEPSVS